MDDDNSEVEVLGEEEESQADSEMTMDCPLPVSITITIPPPVEDDTSSYLKSSPSCSEVTYDDDDRASSSNGSSSLSIPPSVEASPAITTRSLGSRSSLDGFHSSSTPSSLSIDRELVAQTCASLGQTAPDVQELDLSTSTRKPRRPLKSLRALSELTNLVQLDMSGNAVERLDGLQMFTHMQTLMLARNNLKSLGAPLFALKSLTHLDLSGNFITHLPRAFSGLTQLEALNLSGNNLGTLKEVDVLAPLANLLACNISANPFCRLPTYKDYIICKVRSLERLDDMQISATARDRAAKRFGTAMFSQDACLREADRVHEHEQHRLLEAQSALEAENLRLKGELQVKSKLLQNKSRAWSSATEQLLQLQQEVAMLNLDRRRSVSLSQDQPSNAEQIAMAIAARTQQQQRPQSAPRIPSPDRSVEKRRGSFSDHNKQRSWNRDIADEVERSCEVAHQATSPMQLQATKISSDALIKRNRGKIFVDASCSPLRLIPTPIIIQVPSEKPAGSPSKASKEETKSAVSYEGDLTPSRNLNADELSHATVHPQRASPASPQKQRERAHDIEQVRRALAELDPVADNAITGMMSPTITSLDAGLREAYSYEKHELNASRLGRFPTFEDDTACPAYEDSQFPALHLRSSSASNLSNRRSNSFTEATSSGSHSLPPSPTSSPSRLRQWFRKQNELRLMTPPPSPPKRLSSPYKTRRPSLQASPLAPFVDKDVLVRQIQALQSCKQSLLTEIRNEEHMLHVLKQESVQYEDQIDRLSVNIQACIDGDPSAIQFSFASSGSPRSSSKKRREEETGRARLEILRNKLLFAEDKEKEIETSMVRMTKRVLQADLNPSDRANSVHEKFNHSIDSSEIPFDREIFALTHKLQLVIVEKEEIQMQMSQLMAQLRGQSGSDANVFNIGADAEDEIDGHTRVSSKQVESLAKSRQMVEEFRTRHCEVTDRIQLKERRITSLLEEINEVEAELEHISRLNESSALSPLFQRERSATMEFLQTTRCWGKTKIVTTGGANGSDATSSSCKVRDGVDIWTAPSQLSSEQVSQLVDAAATHQTSEEGLVLTNFQTKELLSAGELEKIKADIYEKLSQQLATSALKSGDENSAEGYRKDLHEAIAAALETRLQRALNPLGQIKLDGDSVDHIDTSEENSPQKDHIHCNTGPTVPTDSSTADEVCWNHFDEFTPVETYYARKYVMSQDRVTAFVKSTTEDDGIMNPKAAARVTGAQRILKMCERLGVAEAQYKVDSITKMELDQLGKNRSSLKIILQSARDLPTTHLRTKNLDPYVSLEVVYPSHAVPPQLNTDTVTEKVLRSQTKKKSMYPIWDEDFEFAPILSLNGYLHVRVLNDRRLSREQLVGETRIPLYTLLHQRRIVEWFSLGLTVPPVSTGSVPPGRVISKVCGGAVRLQLHLTFSCIERYKRVIDELVARYFHDHSQLPPFIDAVEECEKRFEQAVANEQPEENDTEAASPLPDERNTMPYERRQQADVESHFALDELETSLPTYRSWKVDKPDLPPQQPDIVEVSKAVSSSGVRVAANVSDAQSTSTRLSAERSKSLWETKTLASMDRQVDSGRGQAPIAIDERKPPTKTTSCATERKKKVSSSSNAAFHHQAHRGHSRMRTAASLQQHTSLRIGRSETPECFDEYSPYHPAFKNVDPLDACNNELTRPDPRSGSSSRGPDPDRKTDLRIFKSPSVSRRPPSTGFPERYIGLDNQTCERLKRIFGRMDGTPS